MQRAVNRVVLGVLRFDEVFDVSPHFDGRQLGALMVHGAVYNVLLTVREAVVGLLRGRVGLAAGDLGVSSLRGVAGLLIVNVLDLPSYAVEHHLLLGERALKINFVGRLLVAGE